MENNITELPSNNIPPDNQNRKLVLIGVIAIIFILLIFSGFLLFHQKINLTLQSKPIPTPTPVKNIPNVLYPHQPDPSGRNIYYVTSDLGKNIKYSGVGVQVFPAGSKFTNDKGETLLTASSSSAMTNYIVGSFDHWEKIPDSKDMYIILKDLLGVRTQKGEIIPIPKVRVGFSTDNINSQKGIFSTAFGVEELNSVIPKVVNRDERVKVYGIGIIGTIDTQDLEILIKLNDTITLTMLLDFTKQKDLVDKNGDIIASQLLIRRYAPKISLPKELNKPINLL